MTVAWQADRISRSAASAPRAAEPAFRGRRDRKRRGRETPGPRVSCASCTRVTQSMVFFTSGGTDELYSGVTISTP